MFGRLLLLFTVVPIVELALLIWVGQWLGLWPTIGMVVATALVGAWMAHREGARVWREFQGSLGAGRMPAEALLHGLLIFGGGALLLTPGVLTDLVGLALLFPPTRHLVARQLRRRLEHRLMRASGQIDARFWSS